MGGITGWDKGIGTLLGLWLRDQAQKKQEETLRQLLEDQQRQMTNTSIGLGQQQGPMEPPGVRAPTPAPQHSLLDVLTGIPGDILQGATGGPPGLMKAQEQYQQGEKQLARQQTLADWWQQQQLGNQLPLGEADKAKLELDAQRQKELQDMIARRQQELQATQIQSNEKIANMPAKQTPLESLKYDIYKQHPDWLDPTKTSAATRPVPKQIGDNLVGVIPSTGQPAWVIPNPRKQPLSDVIFDAAKKGEGLGEFTPDEVKQMALKNIDPMDIAISRGLANAFGGPKTTPAVPGIPAASPPVVPAPLPQVTPGVKASGVSGSRQDIIDELRRRGLEVR